MAPRGLLRSRLGSGERDMASPTEGAGGVSADPFGRDGAVAGEGKTYDTTAEEQLLEEMERRREAQLANINKLKNEAKFGKARVTASRRFAAIYVIPSALGVSIWKKNIHRDLPLTFKGFPGLC